MPAAAHVDGPDVGTGAIGHDVVRPAHINDGGAVRRDLRVVRILKLEDVEVLKSVGRFFLRRRRSNECQAKNSYNFV